MMLLGIRKNQIYIFQQLDNPVKFKYGDFELFERKRNAKNE